MNSNIITQIAVWLVPLIIAIVFHEVSHGLVARRLGDPTAEERGRLTLNPIKHIDPFGTVILPLILALNHAPMVAMVVCDLITRRRVLTSTWLGSAYLIAATPVCIALARTEAWQGFVAALT